MRVCDKCGSAVGKWGWAVDELWTAGPVTVAALRNYVDIGPVAMKGAFAALGCRRAARLGLMPLRGVSATSWPIWFRRGKDSQATGAKLAVLGPDRGKSATSWPLVPAAD